MTTDVKSPWELESGLINDVDGWITNARFGKNDKYTEAVTVTDDNTVGTQLMFDLIDENGELLGSVGYSVGTGWIVSDDGSEMSNPKRRNVVKGTRYGDFQEKVIKDLKVPMGDYGVPTKAGTWNGLGFHWNQEKKKTVAGKEVDVLMPTLFKGKKEGLAAKQATKTSSVDVSETLKAQLIELAQSNDQKSFQLKVMRIPEATGNEKLMAHILDDSNAGFWSLNHNK